MTRLPQLLVLMVGSAGSLACSLTPVPDVTSEWSQPCDPVLRRCELVFTLRSPDAGAVELRGTFRADAWVRGQPMEVVEDVWTTSVSIPWGSSVQYKFFIDDASWLLDPENPTTGSTGGVVNSLRDNITCPKWTCAAPRL
jgi:hypothetical protein